MPQGHRLLRAEATPQVVRVDPVDGEALAIELEDGQPRSVEPLELRIAGDVDLAELEAELGLKRRQVFARALAEVAVAGDVEGEFVQGYKPRMTLASATRCTASP